jgi:hypothetical protein
MDICPLLSTEAITAGEEKQIHFVNNIKIINI